MTADTDGVRLLVFEADGRRYASALDAIREIVPFQGATRLPGAPPHVVGLINLRGRLVAVADLAALLGTRAAGRARPSGGSIVLMEAAARPVGVLVDAVREVRLIAPDALESIASGGGAAAGALQALARFDDGDAVVLDAESLIALVLQ